MPKTRLTSRLPLPPWARGYRRADLGPDAVAGLTTAVMLVPQGMAYAMLAGLPPVVGLYAAMLPLVAYALLGGSRQLAVGPVAMVSILVATAVSGVAAEGTAEYIGYALVVALLVGIIQLVMGALRLGVIANVLSHPVLSGFTAAAAIVIGVSQLRALLGIDVPRSEHVHEVLAGVGAALPQTHLWTLALGGAAIALLVGLKRWWPRAPRALIVVVLGTLVTWALDLADAGVAIVGSVPAGLPPVSVPPLSWDTLTQLLPASTVIALIAFMESFSVAQVLARRGGEPGRIDPNRELLGLGLANVAAAFTSGYAVAGGFGRSAVNAQAGARTPLAALVTAAAVALTALFLTPLFHSLPRSVLAAIIITAVASLIDVAEVRHLWRVKRSDLAFWVVTFVGTLTLGIEIGIGIGVASSLLWLLAQTSRPHMAVLGRLPGTTTYRNLRHFPDAERDPGVAILRVDARLYFANVAVVRDRVSRLCDAGPVKVLVLDASAINDIDTSGVAALDELRGSLEDRGIGLRLAGAKGPVRLVLRRSELADRLGAERLHDTVHDAVVAARAEIVAAPPSGSACAA